MEIRKLEEVMGHDAPKDRLRRTVEAGRLASTYLFVGPEGVGKRTLALAIARPLLCLSNEGRSLNACGVCDSCRLMQAGSHPDLLEVGQPAGKSTLPLELFIGPPDRRHKEGLCHDLALRPMVGRRRVAVIDDADALSVESANALLKTLEEPPPRSLMILIGTSLARQMPTIRSRCQVLRFGELRQEDVEQVLLRSNEGFTAEEAHSLAQTARGSVGLAIDAKDAEEGVDATALSDCLNAAIFSPGRFSAVVDDAIKSVGSEPAAKRRRLREVIRTGVDHWRRRLVGAGPTDGALDALDALLEAEAALDRNANQAAVTQSLAGRLAAASQR